MPLGFLNSFFGTFAIALALLVFPINRSLSAEDKTEKICSTCVDREAGSEKYCGTYNETTQSWESGVWVPCSANIRPACGKCVLFPLPPGGNQLCGLFDFDAGDWRRSNIENRASDKLGAS